MKKELEKLIKILEIIDKRTKVAISCESQEQLDVAEKFCELANKEVLRIANS